MDTKHLVKRTIRRAWPSLATVFGVLVGILTPGLSRMGTVLSEWAFPPRAVPSVSALPTDPDAHQILLSIGNEGEKLTTVAAVHFCTGKNAWFVYDPKDNHGGARYNVKFSLGNKITSEQWWQLQEHVERDHWIVECQPTKKQTLRKLSGGRKVRSRDAIEISYASPDGVALQVAEGGIELVGGNTWCALTVRFSTEQSVSRVYSCKTDDGESGFKAPPEHLPEIQADPMD